MSKQVWKDHTLYNKYLNASKVRDILCKDLEDTMNKDQIFELASKELGLPVTKETSKAELCGIVSNWIAQELANSTRLEIPKLGEFETGTVIVGDKQPFPMIVGESVYQDNNQNRRLGRVGQKYKTVELYKGRAPTTQEERMENYAKAEFARLKSGMVPLRHQFGGNLRHLKKDQLYHLAKDQGLPITRQTKKADLCHLLNQC